MICWKEGGVPVVIQALPGCPFSMWATTFQQDHLPKEADTAFPLIIMVSTLTNIFQSVNTIILTFLFSCECILKSRLFCM
jgi:hypothetical protein